MLKHKKIDRMSMLGSLRITTVVLRKVLSDDIIVEMMAKYYMMAK